MSNSNQNPFRVPIYIALVLGAIFLLWNSCGEMQSRTERSRLAYAQTPVTTKAMTKALIDSIASAKPGDFLVRKDGSIGRIVAAARNYSGVIEVRVKYSIGREETHFLAYDWVVWAVVDRLVKQTDPDAGAVALKFLSQ